MACHSVGWIMARFISELLADRAWTMAKAARRIELAVLPTEPDIPCCTRSMAEYVGIFARMAIPVSSSMLFRVPLYRDFLELCSVYDNNVSRFDIKISRRCSSAVVLQHFVRNYDT